MKKVILSIVAILAVSVSSFAQTPKQVKRAHKYVEKMNTYITSIDEKLALSEEQKEKIAKVQIQRIMEHDKIKEMEPDMPKRRELNKPVNKKYGNIINKDILSKEQFKAFIAGRKKAKSKKKTTKTN